MLAEARSRWALVVSAMLHAAVALTAAFAGKSFAPHVSDALNRPDLWGGDTFEVDGLVERPTQVAAAPPPASPKAADRALAEPMRPEPMPAEPVAESPQPVQRGAPEPVSTAGARETAQAAPSAASADESAAAAAPRTTFGAAGLEPGVRNLAKAFTRALPVGGRADEAWFALPTGPAGVARVTIVIDDEGRIESAEPLPIQVGQRLPAHLKRLLDRAILLLRAGRFALDNEERPSGSETLRIEAEVREGGVSDEFAQANHTVDMGFDPPTRARSGKAWFSYASGRRIQFVVTIEPR